MAEKVGRDRKGGRAMERKQMVHKIQFQNVLDAGREKGDVLKHYLDLISGAKTVEEACVLVLGVPNIAFGKGPYDDDFSNGFFFLADLTLSKEKEVALCAAWAAVGLDFYNKFCQRWLPYGYNWQEETTINWSNQWIDRLLYEESIKKILLFLGNLNEGFHPKREDKSFSFPITKKLVPEEKFEEAAKRFLKSNSSWSEAGKALLRFRLFEELGSHNHFGMIPQLEEFICRQSDGSWENLEEVEASYGSGKAHACSALRRLKARQKGYPRLFKSRPIRERK